MIIKFRMKFENGKLTYWTIPEQEYYKNKEEIEEQISADILYHLV